MIAVSRLAIGHHSDVEYDRSVSIDLEGEIVDLLWRNPHVSLTLRVVGESGPETWRMEGGPANMYARFGATRDTISVGDRVVVSGNPSTRRENQMWFGSISTASDIAVQGQFFSMTGLSREEAARGPTTATGIFRVWTRRRQGRPSWPEELPLREDAVATWQAWDRGSDPVLRCIAPGMPRAMTNSPYPIEFEQAEDDTILLYLEEFDSVRTIHLDGSPPSPVDASTPLGYSIGWWEDGELVVRTTNIDYPLLNDAGVPVSNQVQTVERFSLSADESELRYQITLDDPVTFTEPIHGSILWGWIPGRQRLPYDCAVPDF